jgi:hypothetical protein
MRYKSLSVAAVATLACIGVAPAATAAEPICVFKPGFCVPGPFPDDNPCDDFPRETLSLFWCNVQGTFTDVEEGDVQCDGERSFLDRAACITGQ